MKLTKFIKKLYFLINWQHVQVLYSQDIIWVEEFSCGSLELMTLIRLYIILEIYNCCVLRLPQFVVSMATTFDR